MAVSKELITALVRLNASHDFQVVLESMKEDLAKADKANRKLSDEPLYRSQGRAVYLEEFLQRVAEARATMEKMRS